MVMIEGDVSLKEKYLRLLKDTGVFALGNLGSKLILFFMVPLYTNYMTTEQYGISDLVSTLAELLTPFISLVIFDAVQRFALAKDECKEDVLLAGLVVSSAGGVAMLALTPLLSLYHSIAEWKWFLSVYVILTMFANVEKNYLKAKDMNGLYSSLSIAQTAALASCNVLLIAYCGMGVSGYLLSATIACLVPVVGPLLFGGLINDLQSASLDWSLVRRMTAFSTPLVLNNVSWWAIHSFDKVLIERLLGASELGIYTVATKMPSMINVLTTVFSQAWGISSIREYETENDMSYYSGVLKALVLVVFGMTLVLVSVIRPFVSIYVGNSFEDSWRYTPLLLVASAYYSIGAFYGSMYSALKLSFNNMMTTAFSAIICIVVTISMIPVLGIWGAVIGTVLAYLGLMLARIMDLRRYIAIDWGGLQLWLTIAVVTVHASLLSVISSYQPIVSVLTMILFIAINWDTVSMLVERRIIHEKT